MTISKKELTYWVIIAALILALATSFATYKVLAEESTAPGEEKIETNKETKEAEEQAGSLVDISTTPHASCRSLVQYSEPVSTVYKPSSYAFTMIESSAVKEFFQDINGDGLVDFIQVSNSSYGNPKTYHSCVFLNTGTGWQQVHACYARTYFASGQVTTREYRGDCADLSS